jgi:hypothetical protein
MHRAHSNIRNKAIRTNKDMEKQAKSKGCGCLYSKGGAVKKDKTNKSSRRCS